MSAKLSVVEHFAWVSEQSRINREAAEAELAALVPPADVFRISKNFETGQFKVARWKAEVVDVRREVIPVDPLHLTPRTFRVIADHRDFLQSFPSSEAALAFIRAFVDPATNQIGVSADGELIGGRA